MLDAPERDYLYRHAFIPEMVPEYVAAISGAEPFLLAEHVAYVGPGSLIFVGYPLEGSFDPARLREQLQAALTRFRPARLDLIAPQVPGGFKPAQPCSADHYFRLDLEKLKVTGKLRALLRRAFRELAVQQGRALEEEHLECLAEFMESLKVPEATRQIWARVPAYVAKVATSRVFTARDGQGRLVALTVAEWGARDYAFYLFNFRSKRHYVPGASDLLLNEVIAAAREQGKAYVNCGLGINAGISFFKQKWGASPFLSYVHCQYRLTRLFFLSSLLRAFKF